jgi:hypothetical protein
MSGLLRRLTRRGRATADENRSATAWSSEPAAAPADAPAEPGGDRPLPAAGDEQQTKVLPATGEQVEEPTGDPASPGAAWVKGTTAEQPATTPEQAPTPDRPTAFAAQPAPVRDLPAGVDPGDLSTGPPVSSRRGKLRRRLRYLRHVRALLLRDLGGFTYEVHRTAGGTPQETHRRLAEAKASRIAALDAEVAAIEARLGEPHSETVIREAGIGGTCPECGELHASDARFCSRCGTPLDAKARAQREAAAQPATGQQPAPEPPPASVLWAGGPRPAKQEEEEQKPAEVTSRWLAAGQPTTFEPPPEPGEDATTADEPAGADEPATTTADEPAGADEPPTTTADEPAGAHEPPTMTADEPAGAHEPPPTPAAESAVANEPPAADEAVQDAQPADPARADNSDEPFEPGPNGRRDEDVTPPVPSGDPLASRPEQAP